MTSADEFRGAVEERDYATVQRIFGEVIADSFRTHPMRNPTMREARHRGEIVLRWFRKLRHEKGWSVDRALSAVRVALSRELDGLKFEPDDRSMYAVDEAIEPAAAALRNRLLN